MKIMIVNTYYYPEIVGGAEYSVKKLAEGLQKSGHQVVVLCTGDSEKREVIDGIDVLRFKSKIPCRAIKAKDAPLLGKTIRRVKDIWNPGNEKILAEILVKEKPDIVHTNGLYDISPAVWKAANNLGIRIVHTLRDYFLCCPLVSMECESDNKKCKFEGNLCPVHRKANTKAVKKYVDVLTAPSAITLNTVVSTMGLHDILSTVVPNAIDYNPIEVQKAIKRKQSHRTSVVKFAYLGTLSEKKGVLWLLNSFQKIDRQNAELYIAGKGELEEIVNNFCSNDSRIHFVGFLNEPEMNKLLMDMDVLVCPSLWKEPFGRVVLDAYKNALPVICTNRGALPELVHNHVTGTVVQPEREHDLTEAMIKYIDMPDIITQESEYAVTELCNYSLKKQIDRFVDIYAGIAK